MHDESATAAVILAGGKGTRLGALTKHECKPALPFGGSWRNIDFSLSNCVNSGVRQIGIATQYKDESLLRHIDRTWRDAVHGSDSFIRVWRARTVAAESGYRGTADAVRKNWPSIEASQARWVLILAGDHVYRMDYRSILRFHIQHSATLTVGCVEVPRGEACHFGVVETDRRDKITSFVEKPPTTLSLPGRNGHVLGSMGIYVFDREGLAGLLQEDASMPASSHDFGRDLIPRIVANQRGAYAYRFTEAAVIGRGYWRDIGTIPAYWRAHMEFLDENSVLRAANDQWPIQPAKQQFPGGARSIFHERSIHREISQSLVATDCRIRGAKIRRAVIESGVIAGSNCRIENSILLAGARIGRDCVIRNAIVAPGVYVMPETVIDPGRYESDDAIPLLITGTVSSGSHATHSRCLGMQSTIRNRAVKGREACR